MDTDESRPHAVSTEKLVVSTTEQEASERPTGAFAASKRIVPSLSALAITFMTIDWETVLNTVGGGNHGGGHH